MSIASWFRALQVRRAPAVTKVGRRQPCRPPTRSRPFLEHLEERMLLNGSAGVFGGDNNLTVDGAAGGTGNVLPVHTDGSHAVADNAESPDAATDALLAQDQPSSQFRLFGINSQGESFRSIQRATANILRDAFGFGSGVQPNAPWAPAAYNLGLANHQYGYPSQTDNGFFSTPPWYHPTAYLQPDAAPAQDRDPDSPFKRVASGEWQVARPGDSSLATRRAPDGEVPTKQADYDPAVEEALFSDLPYTLLVSNEAKSLAAPWSSNGEDRQTSLMDSSDKGSAEENSIPTPLWLSALAPAQMAALVAGLPGVEAPAQDGEAGSAAGALE